MNIPGFTAEASLYNGDVRYRAAAEATVYGGHVQPASRFSDVTYQERSVLSRNHYFGSDVYDPCYWRYRCTWEEVWYDPVRRKPIILKFCRWEKTC